VYEEDSSCLARNKVAVVSDMHMHMHMHMHMLHVTCMHKHMLHVACLHKHMLHVACTCHAHVHVHTCTWRYTLYNLYNPPLEGKGLGALPRALTLRASRIHSYSYTPPGPRDCAWSRRAAGERARDVPLALLSFPNHDEIFRQMQLAHGVRSHPKYAL
jgi:hypothetical protein